MMPLTVRCASYQYTTDDCCDRQLLSNDYVYMTILLLFVDILP